MREGIAKVTVRVGYTLEDKEAPSRDDVELFIEEAVRLAVTDTDGIDAPLLAIDVELETYEVTS